MQLKSAIKETLNRCSVVIVTGGSSGIGCSIIKAILKLREDVVLCNISRSKPSFFLGKNGLHVSGDLSDSEAVGQVAGELIATIEKAPAGEVLLVNNSGFGDYGPMQHADVDKHLNMIDLNIRAMVDLTGRLLPQMLQRGGAVMNIASTAAFQPTPFLATYGATKAFVLNWSLALNEDLRGTGVRAMAVCPGPTRSNFFKRAGFEIPPMQGGGINSSLDMKAEEVADLALAGLARGRALVVTGWKNRCIAFFGGKAPRVLVTRIGGQILRKLRLEQKGKP
jgi:short-subunit dehydrogenase